MGLDPSGAKVPLKPLSTEGQGFPGGAEPYSNFGIAIPFGFGMRKSINRTLGIKLELTHRFTFTDYIDDVSTVYYDPNYLATNVSPQAAYFSNPELGNLWDRVTAPGQQRGDLPIMTVTCFLQPLYISSWRAEELYMGETELGELRLLSNLTFYNSDIYHFLFVFYSIILRANYSNYAVLS